MAQKHVSQSQFEQHVGYRDSRVHTLAQAPHLFY